MRRAAALLALALAAAGCAAPAPAPVVRPAPPAPVAAPPAGTAARAPAAAVRDSSPTPEALAVLASIPEPLGSSAPAVRPAPPEAYDTLRIEPPAREVPVPARTEPLGVPAPLPAADPPAAAPVAPAAPAPAGASPADGDTCWRVQVAAPTDREKGKTVRDAAESLLMVPMIVDREGGRFKVRSRDCLSRRAAESLRDRAAQSGFPGVFLVRLPGAR